MARCSYYISSFFEYVLLDMVRSMPTASTANNHETQGHSKKHANTTKEGQRIKELGIEGLTVGTLVQRCTNVPTKGGFPGRQNTVAWDTFPE